ncbi:MAG: ATP-binding protein, partial [Arcobacteraceae bacterium]|nr:ATP-binding protein [Arcobacteraceae bacterium]
VKLSERLAVSISIIMVVAVGILFFNMHTQLTTTTKMTQIAHYQQELHNIKNEMALLLDKAKGVLNTIGVVDSDIENRDEVIQDKLEFYLNNNKEIREIEYLSLDGRHIAIVSTKKLFEKADVVDHTKDQFFQTVLKRGYYVSDIYFSEIYDDMMVNVGTRVVDAKSNKTVGVLYSKVSMSHVQELITDKLIDFDSVMLQSLHTKEFIYESSNAHKFKESVLAFSSNLETIEKDGESYIMVSDVYIDSYFKMKFYIFMKEDKLFKEINETMKDNLFLLVIIVLFTFLSISLIVTEILKPLRQLVKKIIIKSNIIDSESFKTISIESDEVKNMELYFNEYINLLEDERDKIKDLNENLQKKVDEEVENSKKKDAVLFEQTKYAQMGEMIGNIAHQWRQPLSVISTSASGIMMKKEFGVLTDEKENEMLESIINTALFLSKTIDTFRNYIKEEKELKDVVLQEAIYRDISIIEASLSGNYIELINDINRVEPLTIRTLANELSQVIINLLNNAKDVLVERQIGEPFIKIALQKEDEKAIITIEDNGGGIKDEILPKIFDPYFTTKHQSQGTGLGLYMSKEIIEKHLKGKLYGKNSAVGAVFTIELPLLNGEVDE